MWLHDLPLVAMFLLGALAFDGWRVAARRLQGSHYSTRRTAYWPWLVATACALALPWCAMLRLYMDAHRR